jgi:hypothetical protein
MKRRHVNSPAEPRTQEMDSTVRKAPLRRQHSMQLVLDQQKADAQGLPCFLGRRRARKLRDRDWMTAPREWNPRQSGNEAGMWTMRRIRFLLSPMEESVSFDLAH